jgi:hypothetical protein
VSSPLKNFALPAVALVGIIAYWIWRSSAPATDTPPPAVPEKAAPPATTSETRREPGAGATAKGDAAPPPSRGDRPEAEPPRITERDRAKTDALRLALRERQTRRSGGGGSKDVDEDAEPLGTLDKDYIRARIQEDLVPIAKECYESALEDEPKLAGRLVMKFAIVGDEDVGGVVEEANVDPESDIKHVDLLECMKESMLALSFPPPEGGGRVEVTYPFVFESVGPEDAKQ